MNPYIRKLISEHEHGLVQLGFLDDSTRRIVERGFDEENFRMIKKSVEFISREIREHIEAEEKNLFPIMEKRLPVSGPIEIMRSEHRILWKKMDRLAQSVYSVEEDEISRDKITLLRTSALDVVNFLGDHINKENSVLFQLAERILSQEELNSLAELA
ncbi:MAG: hemerythrin domain-containing protein [Ignavibacteria bacterium]|nr:hemerythrin domain-containing protein [Ignavibacteria bacterium]